MKKIHRLCIFLLFSFITFTIAQPLFAQKQKITLAIVTNISSSVNDNTFNKLKEYLSQQTGAEIVLIKPQKTLDLVGMLKEGKVDVAIMNTFGYILAQETNNVEPLLMIGDKNQKPITYQSCIIVNPDSLGQMKNIEDIRRLSHHIDFMFVNSGSTSGHLVPRLYMAKEKINPAEMFFNNIVFGGTHQKTVLAIKEGKALAGACSYDELQEMIQAKAVEKDDVRIIWISEPIYNSPVIVKKDLPNELKYAIKQAFIQLPTKNAQLQDEVKQLWHNTASKNCTYVETDDKMYDSVRKMASAVDNLSLFVKAYANQ